jgi:hypothetical protein
MGMMKDIPLQVALHSYQSRSKPLTSQRLVNMYAEKSTEEAKNGGMALLHCSGLNLRTTVGNGPINGLHRFGSLVYVVSGNNCYTLSSIGTISNLGSLGTVSGGVVMANNGIHVTINLPGGAAYNANSSSLTQITDSDFQDATSVAVLDGFTIFTKEDSDQYFISDLRDATNYDALGIARAERSGDLLIRAFTNKGEALLFGEETLEIHYNSGAGDFPFIPKVPAIDRGIAAKLAVAADDNTVFWIGDDKIIYRLNGYRPERISHHGIEAMIEAMDTIDDAEADIYTDNGHKFLAITFPTELVTIEYDIATGLWHERESFEEGRWRASNFVKAFGKNLVGDFENGNIYEVDSNVYTENSGTIQRIITMPPVYANGKRINYHRLHVDCDAGVGLTSGQGVDPQVILDWSNDGGNTYGNELWRPIGAKGNYKARAVWGPLGQARHRTHRITYTDPTKFNITGGEMSYSVLSS